MIYIVSIYIFNDYQAVKEENIVSLDATYDENDEIGLFIINTLNLGEELFNMTINTNQFLISVADAVLIDKDSDAVVLKSKALLNSTLKQTVQNLDIRGGFGNKLLFNYVYQKDMSITLEDARWDETYLAINNNTLIATGADNIYIVDELVTLSSGVGTLTQTPVDNVYVEKADGTFVTVTPSGSTITISGGVDTTVKATYKYSTTIDKIVIGAESFPKTYRLILKAKLFQTSSGQTQTGDLEIFIENFKPLGECEITFGASTTSTSKLDGKALSFTTTDGTEAYAEVRIRPISGSVIQLTQIAVNPGTCALDVSDADTQQLTVLGIQSAPKGNVTLTTGVTFASSASGIATVSAGGLITPISAGDCIITATHTSSSLTDICSVTVTT